MNISEIKQLPDDSWVEGPITAQITSANNIQTKTGKLMGVAKLGDDSDTIDLQSFDKQFTSYDGKTVELSGKGMKKESYNGYAKLRVGRGVQINVVDGSSVPQTTQSNPAPAQTQRAAPTKLTLEDLADEFVGKLTVGYKVAESVLAELDGQVEMTSEDRRSIAISFVIEANRKGL